MSEKFVVVVTFGNTTPFALYTSQGRTYDEAVELRKAAVRLGYRDARVMDDRTYERKATDFWKAKAAKRQDAEANRLRKADKGGAQSETCQVHDLSEATVGRPPNRSGRSRNRKRKKSAKGTR
jgi:hypothetical protein